MKIEKISDNQIRCTLSHQDLEERELKISELAYGTDKAKELFRDMMQQASYQFGFEAEDIPLMIEAIPISRETLILVITKVEDPDELDTRFSKFSPDRSSSDDDEYNDDSESITDQLFNTFEHITELLNANSTDSVDIEDEDEDAYDEPLEVCSDNEEDFVPLSKTLGYGNDKSEKNTEDNPDIIRIFSFASLDEVTRLAIHISGLYEGDNTIYKDTDASRYLLVMHRSENTPEDFNKVCNLVSEYGRIERSTYASESHCNEHYQALVKNKALQVLANL